VTREERGQKQLRLVTLQAELDALDGLHVWAFSVQRTADREGHVTRMLVAEEVMEELTRRMVKAREAIGTTMRELKEIP
jgi:hypothetical protein